MGKALEVLEPRNMELGPVVPGSEGPWKHWKLARDDDGVAWVVIDKQGASANTLSEDVLIELADVLEKLERDLPKGVVLRSAKRSGFIAGADIGEFRGMTDAAAIEARLTKAHAVVDWLDRLKVPTVAVIHGYCLGGGLEIALACDYRIAVDDARFGFPEVMLGLHPGLGGTVRLPRLINPIEAMSMMLTGRNVRAGRARSLGLVDAVVPERHVKAAAQAAVTGKLKTRRGGVLIQLINTTPGRKLARQAHARRDREESDARALSGAVRADRSLGDPWRRRGGHAKGRDRVVRQAHGHRHVAQPRARVLPARQAQGHGRRRLCRPPRARDRRRRHGRRHRGLVRLARLHRHPRRHEARAARQGDRARGRPLRQDRP